MNIENANNLALLDFGSNETLTTINDSPLQFMGILNLNPFNSSGLEGQQWILPRIDRNFSSTTYSKLNTGFINARKVVGSNVDKNAINFVLKI